MAQVIFLGSSEFAVPSLRALVDLGHLPIVVTKPDKPAGRGNKVHATPVKEAATQLNLPILQPAHIADLKIENGDSPAKWGQVPLTIVNGTCPRYVDLIISIAYGDYIPPEILKLPRHGCVNLHPSLLPKYRGAAPVQRAIMAGEQETGITLAYVTPEWDAGDILLQEPYPIEPDDTAGALLQKLAAGGAPMLKKTVPALLKDQLTSRPQDSLQATYAPKIKDSETWINWEDSGKTIINLIRGLSPQPGAKSRLNGSVLKIHQAKLLPGNGMPGKIVELHDLGPVVAAGENRVLLTHVQPENRNVMSGKDYINGYRLKTGQNFEH